MSLTPLGVRTLEGFKKRYGDQGEAKFNDAIARGLIDGSKMETPDGDEGSPPDTTSGVQTSEGVPKKQEATKPGTRKVPTGLARSSSGSFQSRPG